MAISSLSDVKRVIIRWGIVKATNATRMDIATGKTKGNSFDCMDGLEVLFAGILGTQKGRSCSSP